MEDADEEAISSFDSDDADDGTDEYEDISAGKDSNEGILIEDEFRANVAVDGDSAHEKTDKEDEECADVAESLEDFDHFELKEINNYNVIQFFS